MAATIDRRAVTEIDDVVAELQRSPEQLQTVTLAPPEDWDSHLLSILTGEQARATAEI